MSKWDLRLFYSIIIKLFQQKNTSLTLDLLTIFVSISMMKFLLNNLAGSKSRLVHSRDSAESIYWCCCFSFIGHCLQATNKEKQRNHHVLKMNFSTAQEPLQMRMFRFFVLCIDENPLPEQFWLLVELQIKRNSSFHFNTSFEKHLRSSMRNFDWEQNKIHLWSSNLSETYWWIEKRTAFKLFLHWLELNGN